MSLLIFEPYFGGHRGLYLDALLTYYSEHHIEVPMDVVLSRSFAERHPDTWRHAQDADRVTLHVIDDAPSLAPLLTRDAHNGRALSQAITRLRPTHSLAMYVDHLQVSLGGELHFDFPTRISGVYFRPSFHYGSLGGPRPDVSERVTALRKRLLLRWARRNPHLDTLLSLDPFAVDPINRMGGHGTGVFLPDPVPVPRLSDDTAPPTILDHTSDQRRTILLFGVLNDRKGVAQVCEALHTLSPTDQSRLTLALAGPLDDALKEIVRDVADATNVEVLLDDRFVPDAEIQRLIGQSDLVLLTYQKHVGSSNVLIRAAAAGVPVLAADYGLVGAQVRMRALGTTVDASDPQHIAQALAGWLADPESILFDAGSARAFREENTATAYAQTIFSHLLAHPGC